VTGILTSMRRLLATTAIAAIALAPALAGCGSSDSGATSAAASTAASPSTPAKTVADATAAKVKSWSSAPPMTINTNATYTADLATSKGDITIALDPKKAPNTVNNFVFLAKHGFYDGLTFHRVIPGFVIQGGDPQGTGSGGPGYQFADELPQAGDYKVGSVAMANAGPNTNGSQFFIITGSDGAALPPAYSLFGTVATGQAVANAISKTAPAGSEAPDPPVVITKVTITEGGAK